MEYKHRITDQMLAKKLASKGAILIEGPKWCGKDGVFVVPIGCLKD